MPAFLIITLNTKAAAVTSCDGLNCVSTTLSITPGKDQDRVLIPPPAAHFKPH